MACFARSGAARLSHAPDIFSADILTQFSPGVEKPGNKSPVSIRTIEKLFPSAGSDRFKKIPVALFKNSRPFSMIMSDPCLAGQTFDMILSEREFLVFDKSSRHCTIYMRDFPLKCTHPKLLPHLNSLKLLLRLILHRKQDGTIIHASSVDEAGNGYAFVGPSGSGKSTIAGLLAPARILSDDTSVIRKAAGGYLLFSNPWWNRRERVEIIRPRDPVKLKGIFFIEKARKTSMRKLVYKEALAALIYRDWDFQQKRLLETRRGTEGFFVFAQELMHSVPAFELKFKKNAGLRDDFLRLLQRQARDG